MDYLQNILTSRVVNTNTAKLSVIFSIKDPSPGIFSMGLSITKPYDAETDYSPIVFSIFFATIPKISN